jgi:hypothetical protein
MLPDPYHYRRNRAILAVACLIAAIAAGFLMWPGRATDTRLLTGVVMEINAGDGRSLRTGSTASLVTAAIALDDGQRVRVLAAGVTPRPGERVTLRESRYTDGSVRYRLE